MPAICTFLPAGQHRAGGLEEVGFVSYLFLVRGHLPRYRVKVVPSASVTQPTMDFGAVRSRVMPPIGHLNPTGTHRTRTIKQIKNRTNLMTPRLHLPRFRIEVVPSTSIIQPTTNFGAVRSRIMPSIGHLNPTGTHRTRTIKQIKNRTNLMTPRLHLPRYRVKVVPSTSIIQPACGKSARRGCVEPRIRVAEPATCHGPVRVKVVGGAVNARP